MKTHAIKVAIDGPAAAGKSTVAKIVAQKLACIYIDTGAMYRALTLKALNEKIPVEDETAIAGLLYDTKISLVHRDKGQLVFLDDQDVTLAIRSNPVTNHVSYVAEHPSVRTEMVKRQKSMAEKEGIVMDGRDIGTHVLPDAEVKIFLKASVEERARRRYEENLKKGFSTDLAELKKEIEQRDLIDTNRAAAPLIKADDATEIDTTALTIDEVATRILELAAKTTEN